MPNASGDMLLKEDMLAFAVGPAAGSCNKSAPRLWNGLLAASFSAPGGDNAPYADGERTALPNVLPAVAMMDFGMLKIS